jgi:hypothetical protein
MFYMPKELPTKTCTKCKQVKYLFEYDRNSKNRDGLCGDCKACRRKFRKEHPTEHQIVSRNVPGDLAIKWGKP